MSGLLDLAHSRIAAVEGYRAGRSSPRAEGKLSSNESGLGAAPSVRSAIAASAATAHRYPEAGELRRLVAEAAGLPVDQVVLGNGSDEICYLVATLFIGPGTRVVLSQPCYRIDEIVTRVQLGEPEFVPLQDGRHDIPAMADAAADAAVMWLPTPHNPTGTAVVPGELDWLLDNVPAECLVVLDEAYRAYVDPELRPDVQRLLKRHPNLVVQRTFSKAHALAGLRIGYALASAEVAAAIERIRPPFNVNAAGVAAACAALADGGWSEYSVALVRRERARLEALLSQIGWQHHPSQANFVTLRPPAPGRLLDALAAESIAVRDGADLGIEGWLRVTVGSPAQMAVVRRTFTRHAREAA
jgi:histidinol-phosphate aminotransferase